MKIATKVAKKTAKCVPSALGDLWWSKVKTNRAVRSFERRAAWFRTLGDYFLNHPAGDVGQSEVATIIAVGQPQVINAQ
jgi:hypothetical protein